MKTTIVRKEYKMNTMKKLFVLVMIVAVGSLSLMGCNDKHEHPNGEHPSTENASEEHPKGEHPK